MFKPILPIVAGLLCSLSVFAQGVALQSDHPETYTVVRGDTLWDIAERFLQNPWLWPEIWQANPQIENPHLIYPGDVIRLVYVDGQPRLRLERGERPIVKLSPHARATPLREAIQPIELNEIRRYFGKRTVLNGDELENLPYVVKVEELRQVGSEGQRIYVRGLDAEIGDSYAVVRPTYHFTEVPSSFPWGDSALDPEASLWAFPSHTTVNDWFGDTWRRTATRGYWRNVRSLGYEVLQTAVAEVTMTGDPTTLLITSSDQEVLDGDVVIPVFTTDYDSEYFPRRPAQVPDNMRVLALSKSLFGAGPGEVVALNRGSSDGVKTGEVFAVFHEGPVIRDKIKHPPGEVKAFFSRTHRKDAYVKLPDEYAAHMMIFKTYENMSYGLVVRSKRAVRVNNLAKAP